MAGSAGAPTEWMKHDETKEQRAPIETLQGGHLPHLGEVYVDCIHIYIYTYICIYYTCTYI